MGQFGAGGSVFGATAAAEPGNFHVLLPHVATLELSGVPKKSEGKMAGRGAAAGRARAMFGRDEARENPKRHVPAPTRRSRAFRGENPAHRRRLPC